MKLKSKRRTVKNIAAVTAAFVLLFSTAGSAVYAAEKVTKDETVYVITNGDGSQQEAIVSDHLVNSESLDKIADESALAEIENVKSDETFDKGDGNKIVWNADGNDIYYQGKTDDAAPVTMKVAYTLDGKDISGSELQGKSGHVKIKINYENNATVRVSGKNVKVPFVVMTGFMAKDECLSNVTVSSGKVIDDGEKQVVVGMAAPGLSESLGVSADEIGFSDYVEISADAENFDVEDMMTIVTSSIFEDIDSGKLGSLDMDGQIKELNDASVKLMEGSSELYDGVHMLNEKSGALTSGVDALNKGAQSLGAGTAQTLAGSKNLAAGSAQLSDALSANLGALKTGASGLYSGSAQLYGGLTQMQGQLAVAMNGDGAENPGLVKATRSVADGAAALQKGISGAVSVSKQNLAAANALVDEIFKEDQEDPNYAALKKYIGTALAYQDNIAVPNELVQGSEMAASGTAAFANKLTGDEGVNALVTGAKNLMDGSEQIANGLGAATADQNSLTSNAKALAEGADALAAGQEQVSMGAAELAAGMAQLDDSSEQLVGGIGQLDTGALELSKGMKQFYEQGIKKIVDLYNSDLKGITGNVDAVIKAGQQYKSFTNLPSGMDGSVKFIYKTDITK